jgi:DNA-binding transcriptional LysR family regulator
MDRLDAMAVLLAVIDAGSLSAGARRLGMPLTTVSRKVSELEAHLRTRLLNRSSRRITLTDAGRSYVAACRRLLEDLGEAERAAAGEYSTPKGDLTITAPIVFGRLHVLPVVLDFLRAYPDIDVGLLLTDHPVSLLDEHVDLAARIGALPESSLVTTRVGTIRQVVCASRKYFAQRGKPKRPEELAVHDCVTFQGLSTPGTWSFAKGKSDITVAIHSRLVVNTAEAAIDAALAGVGITRVLSYQIADARRSGALDIALENFEPTPWPVNLVYPGQGRLPLKLRAFLDFAAPRLKARLPPNTG